MTNLFPPPSQNQLAQAMQQALALHQRGDLAEAEKAYKRILKSYPDLFDALHLYGMLNFQRGKAGEALRLITQAIKIEPRVADAHSNLGMVLATLKREADALASFERALQLEPNNLGALNNRGRLLVETGRAAEGLACFDKVLALEPRHVEARINRGNAHLALKDFGRAIADYDSVLVFQPNHAGTHYNRGNALFEAGRVAEAIGAYDRAVAIKPDHAMAWNSRGVALQALNRNEEAVASFDKALAARKDYADALFNQSLALLTLGDYANGFAKYEWRWRRSGMENAQRKLRQPLWLGDYPLAHKTILVHAEQGLGDTIQFARYVPLLAQAGARVILEVPGELKALMSGLSGAAAVIARGEDVPAFDVHAPLGSLPLALKTPIDSVPADIPYLQAPRDRVALWADRVPQGGLRVALVWSGRTTHANDRNRSIPLAALAPLWSLEGVQFISLQRDLREADAAELAAQPRIAPLGTELSDFADTAAVLSLVDVLVSVDTSVAHLAGAMGRPVFILVPFAPDWRWTLQGEHSPWYPQARLLRQPGLGDWGSVVGRLRAELAAWALPAA